MSNSPSIEAAVDDIKDEDNNIVNNQDYDSSSEKHNIFADGILEEFNEKEVISQPWQDQGTVVYPSKIIQRRKNLFKMVIIKPKKEFGVPVVFYDKEPGSEGNYEVKPPPKTHDYNSINRGILEIGFQTKHSLEKPIEKSFQCQKVRKTNACTSIHENNSDLKPIFNTFANEYLRTDKRDIQTQKTNLQKVEDFIKQVRPKIEEALQSNETIDIFQSDFHLDKFEMSQTDQNNDKKKQDNDVRTFRDNMIAGQKSKKEKSINYIKIVNSEQDYLAHSFIRNLTFEERIKIIGIPYTGQILFWNFKDVEVNSPVYLLELPMEVTMFEFNPINPNILVCALISGQLIIYEFKDIMHILQNGFDSEFNERLNKINKTEIYTYFITPIPESHKTHITSMKWFPAGYSFHKYQLQYSPEIKDINLLATIAEDGQVLVWDCKNFDRTIKNEIGNYIKPVLRIEINKIDSLLKIKGSCLELKIKPTEPYIFVGTDEGQVYNIDWREKVSQDNMTNNIKQHFNSCYFRPVNNIDLSPFYDDIFLTVHDYYFCLWTTSYNNKPIILSPNLKSSFYIGGKFSKSRPGVLFVARNNGQIDIWDFLDESHKPSVKETFLKESITFIDIIQYTPIREDENLIKKKQIVEYLIIGDQSGQMSILEISKLFTEQANEELKLVRNIFDNEIKRQKYMDQRFKLIDEEYSKPADAIDSLIQANKKEKIVGEDAKEETELKYMEDAYLQEKLKMIEDYGFEIKEDFEEEDD